MKDIRLNENHFEMLSVPQQLDQGDFQLPAFPITIEIPYKNGEIQKHVLDFAGVLSEDQL